MNQITSLLLGFLLMGCVTGCEAQVKVPEKSANIATKTKTAQELRAEARAKRLAERNKTYTMVQLANKNIHYRDEGEGHPLLLIHGMGSNLKQWNDYTDVLSQKYRVISMDMPGGRFGQSEAMFTRPSTDSMALFITMLMDELELDKATICGSSYGGATAINVAAIYPERVEKLILIAAAQALSPMTKDINAPTLIMWGEKDPILPLEQAHTLKVNITDSKLIIYKDGPHVPTESHKEETLTDIQTFLEGL